MKIGIDIDNVIANTFVDLAAYFNQFMGKEFEPHEVPYHKLHHAKEKTKHTKISKPDIFIEDNLDECEILAEFCERVFLIDHPWNRREPNKKNIIRVKNWRELGELV